MRTPDELDEAAREGERSQRGAVAEADQVPHADATQIVGHSPALLHVVCEAEKAAATEDDIEAETVGYDIEAEACSRTFPRKRFGSQRPNAPSRLTIFWFAFAVRRSDTNHEPRFEADART